MKNLNIIIVMSLLIMSNYTNAQINGNGQVETKSFNLDDFTSILININFNVEIDASATENKIEITADENLINYLIPKVDANGQLELTQREWVESKKHIKLAVSASNLQSVTNDSWAKIIVKGLKQSEFQYQSFVGAKATLIGIVETFRLGAEDGVIDASKLIANKAIINIWGDANAKVNVVEDLAADVSNDGRLIYVQEPKNISKNKSSNGGKTMSALQKTDHTKSTEEVKFIKFKIKSKGTEIIQAFVKGRNGRGGNFSYGLPIRPFVPRDENWSIGTKLYAVNKLGVKKLIYVVKAEDEGKVITVSKNGDTIIE